MVTENNPGQWSAHGSRADFGGVCDEDDDDQEEEEEEEEEAEGETVEASISSRHATSSSDTLRCARVEQNELMMLGIYKYVRKTKAQ